MYRRRRRWVAHERRSVLGLALTVALTVALMPAGVRAVQAGADGASYTDPSFGWSISWDPETWTSAGSAETTQNEDGVAGNEVIIAGIDSMALGGVFVGSHTEFGGDISACMEVVARQMWTLEGISDVRDADLDMPRAPDDAERTLSFARISGGGFGSDGIIYVECRPLIEAEAVLSIRWLLPSADGYKDALPAFEELIAAIDYGEPGFADDESGDNGANATDARASEREDANESETEIYTDPIFGWAIVWDPEVWDAQEPTPTIGEDDKPGSQVDFWGIDLSLGGVTIASIPAFGGDLAACVDSFRPLTREELEGDGAHVNNLRELDIDLPEAPPDAVRKLFQWDAGGAESQIGYFECRHLVEDEVVLLIKWILPVGEPYEAQVPVFEDLMSGLDLSEVRPA